MKKVGILSIFDENNYGNRLQNYAVQTIVERLGYEVQTIRNINIVDGIDYLEEAKKIKKTRRDNFLKFNNNIHFYEKIVYHNIGDETLNNKFDYFIIGSDQIWNYSFPERFSEFVFLDFVPASKKIALSASFGVENIPTQKIECYKNILGIKNISVREYAGQEILKKFGIDNSVVLIDPTMMLDIKDWEKVMIKPKQMPNKKYILKFFLGLVTKEREEKIKEFAISNNLEIIDVESKDSPYYCSGPSEFLYLVKNAEIVFTDSFHACVFSLLFEKNFLYFNRDGNFNNMNSRLETLFKKFNINNRYYTGILDNSLLKCTPEKISSNLLQEREKFANFLSKGFNMNNEIC